MFDHPYHPHRARLARVTRAACLAVATASIFASAAYAVGVHRVRYSPPHAHRAPTAAGNVQATKSGGATGASGVPGSAAYNGSP